MAGAIAARLHITSRSDAAPVSGMKLRERGTLRSKYRRSQGEAYLSCSVVSARARAAACALLWPPLTLAYMEKPTNNDRAVLHSEQAAQLLDLE